MLMGQLVYRRKADGLFWIHQGKNLFPVVASMQSFALKVWEGGGREKEHLMSSEKFQYI